MGLAPHLLWLRGRWGREGEGGRRQGGQCRPEGGCFQETQVACGGRFSKREASLAPELVQRQGLDSPCFLGLCPEEAGWGSQIASRAEAGVFRGDKGQGHWSQRPKSTAQDEDDARSSWGARHRL